MIYTDLKHRDTQNPTLSRRTLPENSERLCRNLQCFPILHMDRRNPLCRLSLLSAYISSFFSFLDFTAGGHMPIKHHHSSLFMLLFFHYFSILFSPASLHLQFSLLFCSASHSLPPFESFTQTPSCLCCVKTSHLHITPPHHSTSNKTPTTNLPGFAATPA